MKSTDEMWYQKYLSCPDCGRKLIFKSEYLKCSECKYNGELTKPIKIKPNEPRKLGAHLSRSIIDPCSVLDNIDITRPQVSYDGPTANRDSRELLSEMRNYLGSSGRVLDLGCGSRDQAVPIKYMGYQYVGIDYSDPHADILADAHSIPFEKETFNCILSYAVLEHLHNPFVAVTEIERVLKPGGVYIGTVSQGEPFHDSYFHHTSWGLLSLISSMTSFQIKRMWGSGDTLASLSRMGKYPRVVKIMLSMIDKLHTRAPLLAPRKMKWPEKEKRLDKLHQAGSICFVMQKPDVK